MARIRSIKPELLEDEKTATLSDREWRLFVSLLLLADDYGNLRANPKQIDAAVFWASEAETRVSDTLARLQEVGLIRLYSVRGQTYGHINGWDKHQKVDHPGKPLCPGPKEADVIAETGPSPNPRERVASDVRESRDSLAPDLIRSDLTRIREGGDPPPRSREDDPAAPEGDDSEADLQLPREPRPPSGMRADELVNALCIAVQRQHPELGLYAPGAFADRDAREFLEGFPADRGAEAKAQILARVDAFARRRDVAKDGWTLKAFVRAFNTLATPARDPERPPKVVIPPNYPRPRQATRNA